MYAKIKRLKTDLEVNKSYAGERIEEKIQRIVNNKEPISDNAPIIHTERKDGVRPEHNVRTDRFELAVEAMDKVTKSHRAKREGTMGDIAKENMDKEKASEKAADKDAGGKSAGGTE